MHLRHQTMFYVILAVCIILLFILFLNAHDTAASYGGLDHFVFSPLGTQAMGKDFLVTIMAVDASGNTVTSAHYTVNMPLTSAIGFGW